MDLTSMPLAVSDATILYFVGGGLTALALIVSVIGVKSPDFPKNPRTAIGVIAVFMFFVIGSAAYAVLSAREEQGERREHLAEAEKGGEHGAPIEGGTEGEAPAGVEVKLGADPDGQLAYDTTKLSAKAGPVTIDLTNPAPVPHDVVIADGDNILGESDLVSDGGESTATADLESGQYTYYCSVPGHRDAGMEGTLKVK